MLPAFTIGWPVSTRVNKAGGADEATLIDKVN
jgi:hypothetical protein